MTPTIGISRCSKLDDYVVSVERAGGRVRILEVSDSPRALIGLLDGLLLTGGGDVDPVLYGEERHETIEDAEPGRRRVRDRSGAAGGGRGSASAGDLPRCAGAERRQRRHAGPAHSLSGQDRTAARDRAGGQRHRALDQRGARLAAPSRARAGRGRDLQLSREQPPPPVRVGACPGLVATATAPDGVIEAIESPDRRFCLGVQWHPENFWRTGEFDGLFNSFVAAARERMDNRG